MKRLFLSLAVAIVTGLVAYAVPALPGQWRMITLVDGSEVYAEHCGDEFASYFCDATGNTYIYNELAEAYELAARDEVLTLASTRRAVRDDRLSSQRKKRATIGTPTIDFQGSQKGLIILVQFADNKFVSVNTPELYQQIANEENFTSSRGFVGSVRDYFLAQSYGQFDFQFDVVGPVTMPEKTSYYGGDTGGYTINGPHFMELIAEACEAVDDEVDFSDYDWDGDGEADLVFFLYAGQGQNNSGQSDHIYPHMGWVSGWGATPPVHDGVIIDNYACSCELYTSAKIDGIGTICHEFSHCFGLPDLYDMTNQNNYTMGRWDCLCLGNYNSTGSYGNGFVPAGYTSYERWFCGWLEPTVLDTACTVTDMAPLTDEAEAYVIYNDRVPTEYYLLENRNQSDWDAGTSGKGLLVLHIDYSDYLWASNYVNSSMEHSYTIIPANNTLSTNYESGHPYPYNGNDSLTDESTPAARLQNANYEGTTYMSKPITGITRSSEGTISFTFGNEAYEPEADPDAPETYVFYESFNKALGVGGNDDVWAGDKIGSTNLADYTDNAGWTGSSTVIGYCAQMCGMFGTASLLSPGRVTTPAITTTANACLRFKAAPYTGDGNVINIAVASGEVTLDTTSFDLADEQWTTCVTTIHGAGTFTINFSVPSGRFFLDEVYVTYEFPEGITTVSSDAATTIDNRIYRLDGQYVGTSLTTLPQGIYIVNGKKVIL